MSLSGNISDLASQVKTHADAINEHLEKQGTSQLSFALGSPPATILPPHLELEKIQLIEKLDKIKALVEGPVPYLISFTSPAVSTDGRFFLGRIIVRGADKRQAVGFWSSVQALEKLGIAEKIPFDSPASVGYIADSCGLDHEHTLAFLRCAAASHVLEETEEGWFQHNAASAAIVMSPEIRSWMQYVREDMVPAKLGGFDAASRFIHSGEPSECGFAVSLQRSEAAAVSQVQPPLKGFFESMKACPERAERFSHAMKILDRRPANDIRHLVSSLEPYVTNIANGVLVDVGGSVGAHGSVIARTYPNLTVVVEDLPEVVGSSEAVIPDDLKGRMSFQAQDFFEQQQVKGADIYLLRQILHDWSDVYASKILRQLIPALKPGARIILNEVCVQPPGGPQTTAKLFEAGYNLSMKTLLNGKERNEEEWTKLIQGVDGRFSSVKVIQPPQSRMALIEIQWQP